MSDVDGARRNLTAAEQAVRTAREQLQRALSQHAAANAALAAIDRDARNHAWMLKNQNVGWQ